MNPSIPQADYPEYRLTLCWRSDADGNGVRCFLEHESEMLQASFHPTLNLPEAVEAAMDSFFGHHEES